MDSYPNELIAKNVWWKWPLVPLASLFGSILAVAAFYLMQWLSIKFLGGSSNGWFFQYLVPISASGVFGFAFVWCAGKVAPIYKSRTCIFMAALVVVLTIFDVYLTLTVYKNTNGDLIVKLLQAVVAIIAAIGTATHSIEEYGKY
jgi:hypothetical protein